MSNIKIKKSFIPIVVFSFVLSGTSYLGNQKIISSFSAKNEGLPYIPISFSPDLSTFSKKGFDIFDFNAVETEDSGNKTIIFYMQVIDNDTNDFFNTVTNKYENGESIMPITYRQNSGYIISSDLYFYPQLSNINNNNVYYFSFDEEDLEYFEYITPSFPLVYGYGGAIQQDEISFEDVNVENEQRTIVTEYQPVDNVYPYIDKYNSTTNSDVFKINNYSNGTLSFTIKVTNWFSDGNGYDMLIPERDIGVTLVNSETDNDYYKYEQYDGNLVDQEDGYYTYEIYNLNLTKDYSFYSINFSGLSIGNSSYSPKYDIRLNEDLGIPNENLTIYDGNAYINENNGFEIIDETATTSSIQFTINVIDNNESWFYNSIKQSHKLSVTLINHNTGVAFTKDATWIDETEPTNGIYKFEIDNLEIDTNYEIYSLNYTGLSLTEYGVMDNEILLQDDLHLSLDDSSFITNYNSNNATNSSSFFIVLIVIISLIFISIGIVFLILMNLHFRKGKHVIFEEDF